ncbi:MAG: hypothetical protein N2482_00765 [Patescibacteria group bacterium]|nr:hypothetical protein [Patescibacteria group bacterium]
MKNKKPLILNEKACLNSGFKFFKQLPEDKYKAFLSLPILNDSIAFSKINRSAAIKIPMYFNNKEKSKIIKFCYPDTTLIPI